MTKLSPRRIERESVKRDKGRTNVLKLNDSTTSVIVFGLGQQHKRTEPHALSIGDCLVTVTQSVRNVRVQFDVEMRMESHVIAVCRFANVQLCNISWIKRYLSVATT